jgi:hypothetical protein
MLVGQSFGEVERDMGRLRKDAVLDGIGPDEALTRYALRIKDRLSREGLMSLARHLETLGYSQRKVSELTGIARDTLRRTELAQTRKRGRDGEA